MAINLDRRNAFIKAFRLYPRYIRAYVEGACQLVEPGTTEVVPVGPAEIDKMMQIVMAQFVVRLVGTRAKNATPQMQEFSDATIQRYKDFSAELLDGREITVEPTWQKAFGLVESGMAETIFAALVFEVETDLEDKKKKQGEFIEIDFWRDFLLAFVANQGTTTPRWYIPLQAVLLSHMQEFRKALEAVPVNG